MSAIYDISCLLYILGQYFLWRGGLRRKPPEVEKYYVNGLHGLDAMFGWTRKARVRGAEYCPQEGPVIFASNHIEIDDPFVTGALIHEISGGIRPGAMMRDDFFRGMPRWLRRIADPDEVSQLIGAAQISRGGATPAQIEQFVNLLLEGKSFLIYPGRSRSRSGLFFEYREWIRSPGRTSLFPSLVHKRNPNAEVAVVPTARTYNLLTKRSCVAFGPALYLERGAPPRRQRAFDFELASAISDLIEINAPQLLSVLVYLRCLHGLKTRGDVEELADTLRHIVKDGKEHNPARTVDPAAVENPEFETQAFVRFLSKRSLARQRGKRYELNCRAILSVPASFKGYKSENPVKYLANQLLHLGDVVGKVEDRVLGRSSARQTRKAAVGETA